MLFLDDHDNPAPDGEPEANMAPRRRPLNRLLVLAGLCGLAVVQPVLDLLGNNPTALRFRGVEGAQIVLFAFAVVVVPPIVLWLLGLAAGLVDRTVGWYVHLATVAGLFALVGVLLSKALVVNTAVNVLGAVAAAGAGTVAYLRVDAMYLWLRLLSGANVAFLAYFLFLAPVSDWITYDTQTAAASSFADADGAPASVLMVVLDELATQSVITGDERIDDVRFPNLARFAEDATWYRHFSTVSPFTQSAVPALLDGQDPHGEPVWTDHPDNLFSLLADSHHLTVSESLTKLCSFEACSGDPRPPPDAAGGEAASSSSPQWGGLLADTRALWIDRLTPGSSGAAETFDDFAEDLGPTGQERTGPDRPGPGSRDNGAVVSVPESQSLDGFFASSIASQPTRLAAFVDALRPTAEPFFAFLHLVLPHQPWLAREDGTRYATPGEYEGPDITTQWRARVTRQRHLLQAEYTDRLVGVILDRMKEVGEYDDALIVVVSDHGVSFVPGGSVRSLSEDDLDEIAYAPLLVKEPGQANGTVDDANLLSVDLVPTIADILGTEPDWDVDGVPVGDTAAVAARGGDKYLYSYTDAFSYEFLGIEEFADDSRFRAMVRGRFPAVDADESRLAGLYRGQPGAGLIGGSAADVFRPGQGDALVRDLDVLRRPTTPALLAEVAGVAPDASPGDTVVVAVNGTVVGVSPLFAHDQTANQFVVLLPAGAMQADDNRIQAGLLTADGAGVESLRLIDSD